MHTIAATSMSFRCSAIIDFDTRGPESYHYAATRLPRRAFLHFCICSGKVAGNAEIADEMVEGTADIAVSGSTARCSGRWTAQMLDGIEHRLDSIAWPAGRVHFDLSGVEFDTVGAWLLNRTARDLRRSGHEVSLDGADPAAERLLQLVEANSG